MAATANAMSRASHRGRVGLRETMVARAWWATHLLSESRSYQKAVGKKWALAITSTPCYNDMVEVKGLQVPGTNELPELEIGQWWRSGARVMIGRAVIG